MNLLFELGNSTLKWATDTDGALVKRGSFAYRSCDLYKELAEIKACIGPVDRIALASVAADDIAALFVDEATKIWQQRPWFAYTESAACGVINAYANPTSLGVDRWLAMIAVRHICQESACIIDCGTAITLDLLDAAGQHQGGYIIPGFDMMQYALINGAANIDLVVSRVFSLALGQDTQTCVHNGCAHAIIGFLERTLDKISKQINGIPVCFLTGGNAPLISPHLSFLHRTDDVLVLRGLSILLRDRL